MVESKETQRVKERKAGNSKSDCFVGEAPPGLEREMPRLARLFDNARLEGNFSRWNSPPECRTG